MPFLIVSAVVWFVVMIGMLLHNHNEYSASDFPWPYAIRRAFFWPFWAIYKVLGLHEPK